MKNNMQYSCPRSGVLFSRRHNIAFVLALFATIGAIADANTWIGGDGSWNEAANWQKPFTQAPDITDHNAYFPASAAGKTITFTDEFKWGYYGVWYQIQLTNGLGNPVVFTADTDEHGFTSDSGSSYRHLAVGTKGGDGSLVIQRGTYTFNGNVSVSANDNGGANGTLQMTGGTLQSPTVYIGDVSGCSGTVTMSGGTLIAQSGGLYVAQGGNASGTLNVAGGSVDVNGGDLIMSPNGAADATLNVTAGTLEVKNSLKVGGKKYNSANDFSGVITCGISGGNVNVGNEISVGHAEYNVASMDVSGGTISCKTLVLGNTTGSSGTVEITGGTVTNVTGSGVILAKGTSTTGTLSVNGGRVEMSTVANGYINIADGSGSTGRLYVGNDGEIDTQLLFIGTAGTGYMTVTGGMVVVRDGNRGLRVGGNYNGNATGTAYYEQSGGTVTAAAFQVGNDSSSGTVTLSGGVLEVPAVVKGTGAAALNLNGGTLRATAASAAFIPSGLATTIGGTVTIDTDYDITIVPTLSGSGTIVKTGSGKLTFTQTPSCNVKVAGGDVAFTSSSVGGKLIVASGCVYQFDGGITYADGIEVEEGGFLAFAASESGVVNVAVSGSGSLIVATGSMDKTGTATAGATSVTITVSDVAATETTWIGATGADWNAAGNWTHGVPTASSTACFIADAVATASSDCAAGKICLNGHSLTFGAESGNTRRLLAIGELDSENGGALVLKTAKITGAGGTSSDMKPLVIPANVNICVAALSELNDNWGTISVLGKVTLGADLYLYYYVDLFGGVEGSGNLVSAAAANQSRTTDEVIGTRISGSRYFAGDWSDWSGSFSRSGHNTDERIVLCNDLNATNGSFAIYGDVNLGTNATVTGEQTFKFGGLWMSGNVRRIEVPSQNASYVVQVAEGKFDNTKYFNNSNNSTKGVDGTIRKVGGGLFTYTGFGFTKIDVRGGEFMFIDNPYTGSGAKFNERYTTIDELSVAASATLSGTNYTEMAIAVLNLDDGAIVAGPSTKLTNVAVASVDGAKVVVDDTAALTSASYNLITATTMTGTPELYALDSTGNHIPAGEGNSWLTKVRGGGKILKLYSGNVNPGFAIFIR